ncbi:MAG: cobalt-precorrin-5B (C(1))-methyltransferase CbiD [Deltaproteobacteria bacterium]|nr:cobalt-precorrin-5B (C(1))-methyltransferase CbiD [Deltaproteobacteria bacterium]
MLKSGFTTGTAAAAAVKAALTRIVSGADPGFVDILLLTGDRIQIPVHCCKQISGCRASATVIKDAGDDPDVTHGAEIGAIVTLCLAADFQERRDVQKSKEPLNITITGGEGVGQVTLPGLEIPPGEPAINLGPRKMIIQAVKDVLDELQIKQNDKVDTVCVEVFVPRGKVLAEKTLNARLGIIGGISILGTTGIVRPMSHAAYEATIASSLSVARAGGCARVVLTTGRRSERFAQSAIPDLPEIAFVQIGDFFKISLEAASQKGVSTITLAVLFGKAIKMAQGFAHTHAAKSDLSLVVLSEWATAVTNEREFSRRLSLANTARQALSMIMESHPVLISDVGRRMIASARRFTGENIALQGMIFDYTGKVLYNSEVLNF